MKLNKRAVALLISLALLLTAAVGATVAFVIDRSQDVENIFTPSRVACQVAGTENGPYTVKNIGDTTAYIRVAVVVNWKSQDGSVLAQKPGDDDYAITYASNTGWTMGRDGFYYYTLPVDAIDDTQTDGVDERLTGILIANVTKKVGNRVGSDGMQYSLSVELVASAIQTTSEAVDAWSNGVASIDSNGNLIVAQ